MESGDMKLIGVTFRPPSGDVLVSLGLQLAKGEVRYARQTSQRCRHLEFVCRALLRCPVCEPSFKQSTNRYSFLCEAEHRYLSIIDAP